jgi:hypothetical protein
MILDHIGSLLIITGNFDSNEETPEGNLESHLEDMAISPYRFLFTQDDLKFPS